MFPKGICLMIRFVQVVIGTVNTRETISIEQIPLIDFPAKMSINTNL